MTIILDTVVSATLALIVWQDWKYRRIPNLAVLTILLCALLRWSGFSGVELERTLEAHGMNVLLVLLFVIPGSIKSIVGAGDTKLLIALALLWPSEQFLHAFSMGVIALIAACLLFDMAKRQSAASDTPGYATSTIAMPTVSALTVRGLPLGTALGIGFFLSAVI